jgi:hypothetical protein
MLSPNNLIVLIDHFMENLIENFTLAKKIKINFLLVLKYLFENYMYM